MIGLNASNLCLLDRLASWLPAIIIVGNVLDNFNKNCDARWIDSGDNSVLEWNKSPVITINEPSTFRFYISSINCYST